VWTKVVDCALSSMIIPIPNYEECYREDIIVCKCCQWACQFVRNVIRKREYIIVYK
jgi:hypothetical protein